MFDICFGRSIKKYDGQFYTRKKDVVIPIPYIYEKDKIDVKDDGQLYFHSGYSTLGFNTTKKSAYFFKVSSERILISEDKS